MLEPPLPFAEGRLPVGDGHAVHWECCGDPAAPPLLILHGGPGSGCTPATRRRYGAPPFRLVLMDQRGCGRSTPHVADDPRALATITTAYLIADVEALRRHLGIARWCVAGGSWGATLALAYAQAHPARVAGLLLGPVTTTGAGEIDWITRGVARFLPDAWERFMAGLPPDADPVAAYRERLVDPDPGVAAEAAARWCAWEAALLAAEPGHRPSARWDDARFRLGFARQVAHVWHHRAWLAEGQLLRGLPRLAGIPCEMVHGRLDLAAPLGIAWTLAGDWPEARLAVVEVAGHDAAGGLGAELAAAALRLADRAGGA